MAKDLVLDVSRLWVVVRKLDIVRSDNADVRVDQ